MNEQIMASKTHMITIHPTFYKLAFLVLVSAVGGEDDGLRWEPVRSCCGRVRDGRTRTTRWESDGGCEMISPPFGAFLQMVDGRRWCVGDGRSCRWVIGSSLGCRGQFGAIDGFVCGELARIGLGNDGC